MTVVFVTHLVCAAAFAILAGMLLAGRQRSRAANALSAACVATVIWAVAGALDGSVPLSLVALIESLRNLAWLVFLCTLLAPEGAPPASWSKAAWLAVAIVGGLAIGIDLLGLVLAPTADSLAQPQLLARIGVAVLALSLVENQYRNTEPDARWKVIPLCIGVGAIYAFELFFYADTLLSRQLEPSLLAARALA